VRTSSPRRRPGQFRGSILSPLRPACPRDSVTHYQPTASSTPPLPCLAASTPAHPQWVIVEERRRNKVTPGWPPVEPATPDAGLTVTGRAPLLGCKRGSCSKRSAYLRWSHRPAQKLRSKSRMPVVLILHGGCGACFAALGHGEDALTSIQLSAERGSYASLLHVRWWPGEFGSGRNGFLGGGHEG
jgi:hypothetical protein